MSNKPLSWIPVIDIGPLLEFKGQGKTVVASEISRACQEVGFFYIVNHDVSPKLEQDLERVSRQFFSQDLKTKMKLRMSLAGRAWRGYFPVGGELTSGKADLKEGIYFGEELAHDAPAVLAKIPLHGPNLFPEGWPEFRQIVLEYMEKLTQLGHILMKGLSLSLKQKEDYFGSLYTRSPTILFRIFHYPPGNVLADPQWGVSEHTDYGLLTILKQDDCGGLEIRTRNKWIKAPPLRHSFVCNIGDMLDKMTKGHYLSTPHRVLNRSNRSRFSFPFFLTPTFQLRFLPFHWITPKQVTKGGAGTGKTSMNSRGPMGSTFSEKLGGYFLT